MNLERVDRIMDNKLGFYIREEREKLGISQRELAKRIFVDNRTINKIERGITKKIDFETLLKLSKIFNISIYEIGEKAKYNKKEIDDKLRNLYMKLVYQYVNK